MRSFLAIEIPEKLRVEIGALRDRLRGCGAKASWVKDANFHLTLRFLGEADPETLARLSTRVETLCRAHGPIGLRVGGAGVFPNLRRPAVVWVGAQTCKGDLPGLQRAIEEAAQCAGLEAEGKAFHPHITLGRIRGQGRLGTLAEQLEEAKAFEAGEFTAAAVSLFSSELRPGGAVHSRLREFPLS